MAESDRKLRFLRISRLWRAPDDVIFCFQGYKGRPFRTSEVQPKANAIRSRGFWQDCLYLGVVHLQALNAPPSRANRGDGNEYGLTDGEPPSGLLDHDDRPVPEWAVVLPLHKFDAGGGRSGVMSRKVAADGLREDRLREG